MFTEMGGMNLIRCLRGADSIATLAIEMVNFNRNFITKLYIIARKVIRNFLFNNVLQSWDFHIVYCSFYHFLLCEHEMFDLIISDFNSYLWKHDIAHIARIFVPQLSKILLNIQNSIVDHVQELTQLTFPWVSKCHFGYQSRANENEGCFWYIQLSLVAGTLQKQNVAI